MRPILTHFTALLIFSAATLIHAEDSSKSVAAQPASERQEDDEKLMAATHKASVNLREIALQKTIAKDSAWPPGIWGDNLWTLSALYLNEKVDAANARLLKQAQDYVDVVRMHGSQAIATPEKPGNAPWNFFSITDYVRTLCLFHPSSASSSPATPSSAPAAPRLLSQASQPAASKTTASTHPCAPPSSRNQRPKSTAKPSCSVTAPEWN